MGDGGGRKENSFTDFGPWLKSNLLIVGIGPVACHCSRNDHRLRQENPLEMRDLAFGYESYAGEF